MTERTMLSGLSSLRERWMSLSPRSRGITAVGAVVVFFIIIPLVLYSQNLIYSGTISLKFAPKSATAKIGSAAAKFGSNRVRPGTYTVTIEKKGFATYTKEITVKNGENVAVAAALVSNDPSTANWYQTHTDDYTIAQDIGDDAADQAHVQMKTEFPIAQVLPIIGLYSTYRVDYGKSPTKNGTYAVYISYQTEADKQKAIQAVKDKGYDLSKYEVIYEQDAPSGEGVTIEGLGLFSAKGLDSDAAASLQDALETQYKDESGSRHNIAINDNVVHTRSDDGTSDTYSASLTIDEGEPVALVLAIGGDNHLIITLSGVTIFDGQAGQSTQDNNGD